MKVNTKQMVLTGMLIALGIILPMTLHSIPNAGGIFLPMHIPILICGLACGWKYGLICGIITPILSSMYTGMPPMAILPSMTCELAVYGLISGIIIESLKYKNKFLALYTGLITAMICGRLVMGILNALIFKAGEYGIQVWVTTAFVKGIPGIIIQVLLVPVIVLALEKSRLINTVEA